MNLTLPVNVTLPRVLAKKMQKCVARCAMPGIFNIMPGQRHRGKITFSIAIDRDLHMQLKKLAKQQRKTVTDLINLWIYENTQHIELSPEDHEQIAQEIRAWEARQKGKLSPGRQSSSDSDERDDASNHPSETA